MRNKKSSIKNILFFLGFITFITTYSQDSSEDSSEDYSQETNPIIYGDFFAGMGGGEVGDLGLFSGGMISYQHKSSLFTGRYMYNSFHPFIFFTPKPHSILKSYHHEYAALYGFRKIYQFHSISFSAGISHNNLIHYLNNEEDNRYTVNEEFIGVPFEFTIRLFKRNKRRFHIYHVIPVGKPTAFGGSVGLKLVGNVSKNSFIGVGIVIGQGMFKNY